MMKKLGEIEKMTNFVMYKDTFKKREEEERHKKEREEKERPSTMMLDDVPKFSEKEKSSPRSKSKSDIEGDPNSSRKMHLKREEEEEIKAKKVVHHINPLRHSVNALSPRSQLTLSNGADGNNSGGIVCNNNNSGNTAASGVQHQMLSVEPNLICDHVSLKHLVETDGFNIRALLLVPSSFSKSKTKWSVWAATNDGAIYVWDAATVNVI